LKNTKEEEDLKHEVSHNLKYSWNNRFGLP